MKRNRVAPMRLFTSSKSSSSTLDSIWSQLRVPIQIFYRIRKTWNWLKVSRHWTTCQSTKTDFYDLIYYYTFLYISSVYKKLFWFFFIFASYAMLLNQIIVSWNKFSIKSVFLDFLLLGLIHTRDKKHPFLEKLHIFKYMCTFFYKNTFFRK